MMTSEITRRRKRLSICNLDVRPGSNGLPLILLCTLPHVSNDAADEHVKSMVRSCCHIRYRFSLFLITSRSH